MELPLRLSSLRNMRLRSVVPIRPLYPRVLRTKSIDSPSSCFLHATVMADGIRKIGFIGLGLMGLPMVENLLAKTSNKTEFFVYDVVDEVMKKLCSEHSLRVSPMLSAKFVAEQAVCILHFVFKK
jgi:hypothetical protein